MICRKSIFSLHFISFSDYFIDIRNHIVGENHKAIIHYKPAARLVWFFSEQDAVAHILSMLQGGLQSRKTEVELHNLTGTMTRYSLVSHVYAIFINSMLMIICCSLSIS